MSYGICKIQYNKIAAPAPTGPAKRYTTNETIKAPLIMYPASTIIA